MEQVPALEKIAAEFKGRASVLKVDCDASERTVVRFGIQAIPTLIVFKNGQKMEQAVGTLPEEQLRTLLNKYLGN
jgi:thioredoxin-like negative regulator of GroEL